MNKPTLTGLWADAWSLLETDHGRLISLASSGLDGAPECRSVMLRQGERAKKRLIIHTDISSTKIAEFRADPRASLLLWDDPMQIQIRARGTVSIRSGPEVAAVWNAVPDGSRASYGVTPAPGTPIPASDAYHRAPDPAKFAVLTLEMTALDVVHLAEDFHRRALYERNRDWAGHWLAP